MMKGAKYGPRFWSAPSTEGVYQYILLPLLTQQPLLELWMQGNLT